MQLERLVQRIAPHGKLLRSWALTGGVSAQVTALEIEQADGRQEKLVVRQHGTADLSINPQIAADEFRLLQQLHLVGLPVPTPYCLDQSSLISATPYLVVEYIEGKAELEPFNLTAFVAQMAAQLARIHQVDHEALGLSFLPAFASVVSRQLSKRPRHPDNSLHEEEIRHRLESRWPPAQQNEPVLLHGDYWPGNLLWKNEQLVGVIDWEDAAVGDPLADVANTRLEILWAFGREAMESFTHHYQSLNPINFTDLPFWDLYAALRPISKLAEWGLEAATEQRMREHHNWFTRQALMRPI